MVIKDPCFYHL